MSHASINPRGDKYLVETCPTLAAPGRPLFTENSLDEACRKAQIAADRLGVRVTLSQWVPLDGLFTSCGLQGGGYWSAGVYTKRSTCFEPRARKGVAA